MKILGILGFVALVALVCLWANEKGKELARATQHNHPVIVTDVTNNVTMPASKNLLLAPPDGVPWVVEEKTTAVDVPDFGKKVTFTWALSGVNPDVPITGEIYGKGFMVPASRLGSTKWRGGETLYFPVMVRAFHLSALDEKGHRVWSTLGAIMSSTDADFTDAPLVGQALNRWDDVSPGMKHDVLTIMNGKIVK